GERPNIGIPRHLLPRHDRALKRPPVRQRHPHVLLIVIGLQEIDRPDLIERDRLPILELNSLTGVRVSEAVPKYPGLRTILPDHQNSRLLLSWHRRSTT